MGLSPDGSGADKGPDMRIYAEVECGHDGDTISIIAFVASLRPVGGSGGVDREARRVTCLYWTARLAHCQAHNKHVLPGAFRPGLKK